MNTVFLLLAEYESAHAPLDRAATRYLGLTRKEAFSKANAHSLPFPALRASGSRAPWMAGQRTAKRQGGFSEDQGVIFLLQSTLKRRKFFSDSRRINFPHNTGARP